MPKLNKFEIREIRNTWSGVNTDTLSEADKALFIKRKRAVDLYIDGMMLKTVSELTGLPASEVIRLVNRCLITESNGLLSGYSALIPCCRFTLTFFLKFKLLIRIRVSIRKTTLSRIVIMRF